MLTKDFEPGNILMCLSEDKRGGVCEFLQYCEGDTYCCCRIQILNNTKYHGEISWVPPETLTKYND